MSGSGSRNNHFKSWPCFWSIPAPRGAAYQTLARGHFVDFDHGLNKAINKVVRELTELSKTTYVPWFTFIIVYDGLGEREFAIEALQKACANRDTNVIFIKERRVGLR